MIFIDGVFLVFVLMGTINVMEVMKGDVVVNLSFYMAIVALSGCLIAMVG